MSEHAIRTLRSLVTERRAERIERVVEARLKGVTVLLEDIYDQGNIAAVMRTCEALGVHHVHLVDLPQRFKVAKKIGQGAQKWLEVRVHEGVAAAARFLHERGFRLAAGHLDAARTIDEIDLSRPICLVFGNEHAGVSTALRQQCDETYRIPMVGYSQSINISCAAAVSLFEITRRYRRQLGRQGDLDEDERARVRELFYRRTVKYSDILVGRKGEAEGKGEKKTREGKNGGKGGEERHGKG